jgi:hypothetical protein
MEMENTRTQYTSACGHNLRAICPLTSRYSSYRYSSYDIGRANEANDLALDCSAKLALREKLKDAGFNVSPVIMNVVEHGFGLLDGGIQGAQRICYLCPSDVKTMPRTR